MITHPHIERHAGHFYGKYSAVVMSVEDPDKQGHLVVTVPTVFGEDLEVKARPCLPYAHYFVPPVGAHVWIEFEAGDPQFPLWTGCWYLADDAPEAVLDPPTNRVIATVSGHTIELDDTEDAERIAITHQGGTKIEIDPDGILTLEDQSGNMVVLDASSNALTITVQGDVTISADGAVTISGSEINLN